jgi:hypothetical protein
MARWGLHGRSAIAFPSQSITLFNRMRDQLRPCGTRYGQREAEEYERETQPIRMQFLIWCANYLLSALKVFYTNLLVIQNSFSCREVSFFCAGYEVFKSQPSHKKERERETKLSTAKPMNLIVRTPVERPENGRAACSKQDRIRPWRTVFPFGNT